MTRLLHGSNIPPMTKTSPSLPPVSDNPTSVRLNGEDKAALKKAVAIIKKKSLLGGLKLNPSNVLRIALHEFVKNEAEHEQAQNK